MPHMVQNNAKTSDHDALVLQCLSKQATHMYVECIPSYYKVALKVQKFPIPTIMN